MLDLLSNILGCPRIVRTDRGTENCTVAFLQPFLRRNGRDRLSKENIFQYGRSASNQVSEDDDYNINILIWNIRELKHGGAS